MGSLKLLLFTLFLLAFASSAQGYDFFYFVQQWPGSYCNTNRGCCCPTHGKPRLDFIIHGLWPNYNGFTPYPQYCDPNSIPIMSNRQVVRRLVPKLQKEWPSLSCPSSDSSSFWQHEWSKHGTCSVLSQYDYFLVSLKFKSSTNILQCLISAGILPNDGYYELTRVRAEIRRCIGHRIYLKCNSYTDILRRQQYDQLYEVYICIDKLGKRLIDCPVFPRQTCRQKNLLFPSFPSF